MAKKKKQAQQQCLEAAARKNRQERRKRNDKKEREKEKLRKKQEKERKRQKNIPHTAQQSIPYQRMFADGICQVSKNFFSKTVQFYDINYQLALNEDKTTIFENYCDFLNYFDSSISVQLSFINQQVDVAEFEKSIDIPDQNDDFNEIREEYRTMLKNQLSKGNNGLVKTKYITFGIEAESLKVARPRLERIEADILNNFKVLGAQAHPLNGVERLEIMYHVFNQDRIEPFRFNYKMLPQTGLKTKDFIAPTSFNFSKNSSFMMGKTLGSVSYLQILAPELTDRMLADFLDVDESINVNIHIQSIDQTSAIKMIKSKISDLDKMKIEEQKRAVRSGYDMDVLPSDLVTYGEEAKNLLEDLLKRSPNNYGEYEKGVAEILARVKREKDEAVFDYTRKFDQAVISAANIEVSEDEIKEAYELADPALVEIIRKALKNIEAYHEKQRQYSWFDSKPDGTMLGQKVTPLKRVGVYVPGGKAVYPSSVLMNIVPAKVAGVEEIMMVTPPDKDGKVTPNTLVAAHEAGATAIYKVGGAQAIGALAYGTQSIPKVDKIVGPGNIYVALAKKAVYGHVSIDAIAGPSEILVIADESANPRYVAADLLSQAEHDELASAILVTTSEELAEQVSDQVDAFLKELPRSGIISKSLDNYGYILIADSMEDAIETANEIASEHLEIQTKDPYDVMTKIRNAGAIFIGEYSSEPLGDYFAGPNHVLPTNGTAKFFSPLSVDDFIKKSSIISYSRNALEAIHEDIEDFAKAEQLTAHANSIKVRFE